MSSKTFSLLIYVFSAYIFTSNLLTVAETVAKQHECKVRQYNFTAIQKDSSGKRCRDKIQSFACFGACETLEYGTAKFPHKAGVQTACQHDKFVEKTIELKFCEPGATDEAKTFSYTDALSCKCDSCNPSSTKCVSGLETRKKKISTLPVYQFQKKDNEEPSTWEDIKDSILKSQN